MDRAWGAHRGENIRKSTAVTQFEECKVARNTV